MAVFKCKMCGGTIVSIIELSPDFSAGFYVGWSYYNAII